MPLIVEMELDLSWLKDIIISEILETPDVSANPHTDPVSLIQTTDATFQINNFMSQLSLFINDAI